MTGWAASELQFADLGDIRRNQRLVRLVEDLATQPNASVPQASGDLAATQAAYHFGTHVPHLHCHNRFLRNFSDRIGHFLYTEVENRTGDHQSNFPKLPKFVV